MAHEKLRNESSELHKTLARRSALGRWYFVLAMCYMSNKPPVSSLGCQIGAPGNHFSKVLIILIIHYFSKVLIILIIH